MRPITEIIVHCTATQPDWMAGHGVDAKVNEIRRWHKQRGWSDIGYHYIIDRDGTVASGRPLGRTGAHVKGKNTRTIGVSLVGGHGSSENDDFFDNFTPEQDKALRRFVAQMNEDFGGLKLSGHNEYSAKACPGFKVRPWYENKPPRSMTQSKTIQGVGVTGTGAVAAGGTAISQLDGAAQIVAIVGVLLILAGIAWIARERIKKWARGVR